jgi:serine protease Do
VQPVIWEKSPDGPPLGSLLTVTDADDKPAGIGLVSVKTRALGQIGFLGVSADQAEGGVLAKQVVKDGPAAKAGLKQGDIITKVDDKQVNDPVDFAQTIRSRKVGETVRLGLLREGKKQSIEVKLGLRPSPQMPDRFKKMNQMSGPLSEKTAGFPQALQHDIPIPPSQCGGPLLDLDGRCVGINVSRAGRVKTLAIPASEVAELLASVRQEMAEKPARQDKPAPGISAGELEEINNTLQDIQRTLKSLEQRLNKAESR